QPDHGAGAPHDLDVVVGEARSAAGADHHRLVAGGGGGDHLPLQSAELLFVPVLPDLGDGEIRDRAHQLVGVDEVDAAAGCDVYDHGGRARAHHPDALEHQN